MLSSSARPDLFSGMLPNLADIILFLLMQSRFVPGWVGGLFFERLPGGRAKILSEGGELGYCTRECGRVQEDYEGSRGEAEEAEELIFGGE